MTSSIGPSQPQLPHGYSSQIGPADLSPDLQKALHMIVDVLQKIKEEAQKQHPNIQNLIANFELFDHEHTDFLAGLNKNSNRGHVNHIKNTFETKFHHFTH